MHNFLSVSDQNSFSKEELYEILESLYVKYNNSFFIDNDPISIPHRFNRKEDVEIAAFISSTLAWGQRCTIINNSSRWMELMDNAPYDFIVNHEEKDLERFSKFVHRTFNAVDAVFFMKSLQNIYINFGGLENVFVANDLPSGIIKFREIFFALEHEKRTEKHVANLLKNSSCKRLCMFLRWMVRKDEFGVDFGIWNVFKPSQLYCPLDVHTGNTGRMLGILKRSQDDWKAVEELTSGLREFDPVDPVKYDFSLFGFGIENKKVGN